MNDAPVASPRRLRVLFAPDYRAGNPYQMLLARALKAHGIDVVYSTGYRRALPLARGVSNSKPDIVHIHWPEAYFRRAGDQWDRLRVLRYPLDLWLTSRQCPIVVTAHNLLPHNRVEEAGVRRNIMSTMRRAAAVFAHGDVAKTVLIDKFGIADDCIEVIPFGDHAVTLGEPMPRQQARELLGHPADEKLCLMFGTVSPYKGSSDVVKFWIESEILHRLVVVGPGLSDDYAAQLRDLARNSDRVDVRVSSEWLDDATLRAWLSAADCVIFNYRAIFTSGAGALARSFGVPLLLPRNATPVELHEPHKHVHRFGSIETDFRDTLERALAISPDYSAARDWRQKTSWETVAVLTAAVYRRLLADNLVSGDAARSQ
jgi:beta-1,4-mannosyltransferase